MAPHQTNYTEQEQPKTQQPAAEDPVAHPTDSTKAVAEPKVEEPEVDSPPVDSDLSVRPMKGSQRRRSRAEMSKKPEWLPADWQVELTKRKRGKTAGTYDPHYISPSGVKYRSKIAVEEALKHEEESGNPNAPATSEENTEPADKRQRPEDDDATDANSKEVS